MNYSPTRHTDISLALIRTRQLSFHGIKPLKFTHARVTQRASTHFRQKPVSQSTSSCHPSFLPNSAKLTCHSLFNTIASEQERRRKRYTTSYFLFSPPCLFCFLTHTLPTTITIPYHTIHLPHFETGSIFRLPRV